MMLGDSGYVALGLNEEIKMASTDFQKTLRIIDIAIKETRKIQKDYEDRARMLGLPLFQKMAKVEKSQEKALRKLRAKIKNKRKKETKKYK